MSNDRINPEGYDQEDSYFYQKDAELLARKRAELDAQRAASPAAGSLKCPRCASMMTQVAVEQVKVDRCTGCGGVFLDKGELELLTHAKAGGGLFKRLFGK